MLYPRALLLVLCFSLFTYRDDSELYVLVKVDDAKLLNQRPALCTVQKLDVTLYPGSEF